MKIQCDMCAKQEASVYYTADEASLCHGCDRRVHFANKLASKHPRFSLNDSSDQPPRCDICQDKRAFLFCKEDRAILCRQCDMSIHGANEHTQYHNRFLLAGVKLSASSSCYDSSCSSDSNVSSEIDSQKCSKVFKDQNAKVTNNSTSIDGNSSDGVSQEEGVSMETSSFSEYLMETLPGWHLDEFLDPSASHPYGFYEAYDSGTCTLPFMAHESDNYEDFGTLWSEDLGNLVNSSSSSMDHSTSRSSSLSKRLYFNDMEGGLDKDQYTFNSSSKRPRQLW